MKRSLSLKIIQQNVKDCKKCELCTTRRNAVPGIGNESADIVFVGEAPGEKEDKIGEPFVGRAGQLLDKMLGAIELRRKDIYICNVYIVSCQSSIL